MTQYFPSLLIAICFMAEYFPSLLIAICSVTQYFASHLSIEPRSYSMMNVEVTQDLASY
jgi:hypothetical protein